MRNVKPASTSTSGQQHPANPNGTACLLNTRGKLMQIWRLSPLMAAVLASTAIPGFAQTVPTDNALVLRQGAGQTASSLTVNGATTDIRTSTIHGANAFNSFSRFQIGTGKTVNLLLPTGTSNLINLVSDSAIRIDGTVNSLLASGRIGGNVIFADPYGLVVGARGVLNVGSLSVSTPSLAAMDRLYGAAAGTDAGAVSDLLAGKLSHSALGVVHIEGQVNALDSVTLQSGEGNEAISVSGAIRAGGAGRSQAAVNLGAGQALDLVQSEGRILLTAGGDIKIDGKLSVDGDPWSKAGAIRVMAGRDLNLGGTATISASSLTGNAAGGDVYLWGERNAKAADGVQITARATGIHLRVPHSTAPPALETATLSEQVSNFDQMVYRAVHRLLHNNLAHTPELATLAQAVGTNMRRLNEAFRSCTGSTVFDYLREARMAQARKMLQETSLAIQVISSDLGYENQASFATAFRVRFGMSPRDYRKPPEGQMPKQLDEVASPE